MSAPERPTVRARGLRDVLAALVTAVLAAIVIVGLVTGPESTDDRVDSLTAIIKCPQCQGESIKDSAALTAR